MNRATSCFAIVLLTLGLTLSTSLHSPAFADSMYADSGSAGASRKGKFGLGFIAGEPTGLAIKYWLSEKSALDGVVGYSFDDDEATQLHGDYLWHNMGINADGRELIPLYIGIGGRLKFADDTTFGLRIPVGLNFFLGDWPVDLFLEAVPVLDLAPDAEFNFNGGGGLRYYFG